MFIANRTSFQLLKLINNSLSLNKGNHDRDSVWISDLNQHRFLRFCFCVFSLVLVSIEKKHQTLKTVFDHISKHLEVRQKYSAARRIFNSLLGVWKCGQTLSFVFDKLLQTLFVIFFKNPSFQIRNAAYLRVRPIRGLFRYL